MIVARVTITRDLSEEDLIDSIIAEDGDGHELPLAEALGMLRLGEHTLITDRTTRSTDDE